MTDEEIAEGSELANLTPDEVVVKWGGLVVKVVQSHRHRVPRHAYDDLKQVGYVALWHAYLEWDSNEGVPWRSYASKVIHRDVNAYIMVERRSGLTRVGDVAAKVKKKDHYGPQVSNLGDRDESVREHQVRRDTRSVDELLEQLRKENISSKSIEAAELIARHDMTQIEVAKVLGVSRQRVSQLLDPIRGSLRTYESRELGHLPSRKEGHRELVAWLDGQNLDSESRHILELIAAEDRLSFRKIGVRLGMTKRMVERRVLKVRSVYRELIARKKRLICLPSC